MRYIVTKRFKKKAICGAVNLPYGTVCEEVDGYLTEGGRRLCANTSQNAYDYFSRDDDDHGAERGQLVRDIREKLERRDAGYQDLWTSFGRMPGPTSSAARSMRISGCGALIFITRRSMNYGVSRT